MANGTCYLQECDISCLCGGFYLPKINGFCQTRCGDGIKTQS